MNFLTIVFAVLVALAIWNYGAAVLIALLIVLLLFGCIYGIYLILSNASNGLYILVNKIIEFMANSINIISPEKLDVEIMFLPKWVIILSFIIAIIGMIIFLKITKVNKNV